MITTTISAACGLRDGKKVGLRNGLRVVGTGVCNEGAVVVGVIVGIFVVIIGRSVGTVVGQLVGLEDGTDVGCSVLGTLVGCDDG